MPALFPSVDGTGADHSGHSIGMVPMSCILDRNQI